MVGPAKPVRLGGPVVADCQIFAEFGQMRETMGSKRRAAVSALARKYGRSAKNIYALIERLKKYGL